LLTPTWHTQKQKTVFNCLTPGPPGLSPGAGVMAGPPVISPGEAPCTPMNWCPATSPGGCPPPCPATLTNQVHQEMVMYDASRPPPHLFSAVHSVPQFFSELPLQQQSVAPPIYPELQTGIQQQQPLPPGALQTYSYPGNMNNMIGTTGGEVPVQYHVPQMMPSGLAPVIQNSGPGAPVYQPAYVPGFIPINSNVGGGYAPQNELTVHVDKLHVPTPLPSQASSGADSGVVSDMASLSLGDSNSSNSARENSPQSEAKNSERSEHIADIVTSTNVNQQINTGDQPPKDHAPAPYQGGNAQGGGFAPNFVNQAAFAMPMMDNGFGAPHSMPVYNEGSMLQYSQQVINGGYYYMPVGGPVVPFSGSGGPVQQYDPQYQHQQPW